MKVREARNAEVSHEHVEQDDILQCFLEAIQEGSARLVGKKREVGMCRDGLLHAWKITNLGDETQVEFREKIGFPLRMISWAYSVLYGHLALVFHSLSNDAGVRYQPQVGSQVME